MHHPRPNAPLPSISRPAFRRLWPVIAASTVGLILLAYLLLIISNAIYLGWHDSLYFFGHPRLWQRLGLTLWTATLATALSMLIGIPTGYALSRLRFPWPRLLATLIDLPIMIPPAAVGAFLFGFTQSFPLRQVLDLFGLELGHRTAGVILVQFLVTASFSARLMTSAFDAVNPRFEAVSRSLGATLPQTFFRVTLPLAKRGILASLIVVWARAAAEWEALMLFVGATQGETDTLPFAVYLDWNGGMMGWVVSLSLICIFMAIFAMTAARVISGKTYVS